MAEFSFYKVESFLNQKPSCSGCSIKMDLLKAYTIPLNLQRENNFVSLFSRDNFFDKILSYKFCFVCYTNLRNSGWRSCSKRRTCKSTMTIEEGLLSSLQQDIYALKDNSILRVDYNQVLRKETVTVEDVQILLIAEQ